MPLLYVGDRTAKSDGVTIMASVTIGRDVGVHRTAMPEQCYNSPKPEGKTAAFAAPSIPGGHRA